MNAQDALSPMDAAPSDKGVPARDALPKRCAHGERREEILQAVREACAEDGVANLSVSAITKRAGCTRSLFYHYFADKEAAVAALMERGIDDFIAEIEQWNASRAPGDIDSALDSAAALFKHLVIDGHDLPHTLTTGSGALYAGFLHNAVERVTRYICETTVRDYEQAHGLPIDHIYETFYMLIMGLLMYIRTHRDVSEQTIKDIIASTLHIDGAAH